MKSFPFGTSNMFPQLQPDQVFKPNLMLSFVVFVKASWSGGLKTNVLDVQSAADQHWHAEVLWLFSQK